MPAARRIAFSSGVLVLFAGPGDAAGHDRRHVPVHRPHGPAPAADAGCRAAAADRYAGLAAAHRAATATRLTGFVRWARHPLMAFFGFNVVFALAHVPTFYELTLANEPLHALEHLVFLGTAMLMWMPVLSPVPDISAPYPPLGQVLYLFLQTVPASLLGALLASTAQCVLSDVCAGAADRVAESAGRPAAGRAAHVGRQRPVFSCSRRAWSSSSGPAARKPRIGAPRGVLRSEHGVIVDRDAATLERGRGLRRRWLADAIIAGFVAIGTSTGALMVVLRAGQRPRRLAGRFLPPLAVAVDPQRGGGVQQRSPGDCAGAARVAWPGVGARVRALRRISAAVARAGGAACCSRCCRGSFRC